MKKTLCLAVLLSATLPVGAQGGAEDAEAAIAALQKRLSARLLEELERGGPAAAVAVCRDEAQALTAETARAQGIRVGRTSHRLRNAGNAAPAWAEAHLAASAGRAAAEVAPLVVDLGDRAGVLRPIPTAPACLQCHGPRESLAPGVAAFLASAYPDDRAVGFAAGELRGFFWAEAPKTAATDAPEAKPAGAQLLAEANPRCTICHTIAGKGNPQGPLDRVGARYTRDEIKAWIRTPAEMAKKHGRARKPAMVAFPEFSDEELDAIAAYLASLTPEAERKP
jgi:mono/diheme cytochrome c family protein